MRTRMAMLIMSMAMAASVTLSGGAAAQAAPDTSHQAAGALTTAKSLTAAQAEPAATVLTDGFGCPSTYACFWVNSYMSGTMGKVAGNNSNYLNLSNSSGCTRYPGTWNDCISSVDNNGTSCTVYWFRDANYSGGWHSLSIGDHVYNLSSSSGPPTGYSDPTFNDSISSNRWCSP